MGVGLGQCEPVIQIEATLKHGTMEWRNGGK